jgi:hypothetical protein
MYELKFLLDIPDSDYWYDEGSVRARAIIDENLHVVLQRLSVDWPDLNVNQQEHLAYILDGAPGSIEYELLTQLSSSKDENVARRAREALSYYRQDSSK